MRDLPDDFQLDQLRAALEFVYDFRLAIDIGAHRGIWTKYLLTRFEAVVAIEPTDLARQIDPRARVIQAACGERPGRCRMAPGKRNTGQSYVAGAGNVQVIAVDSLKLSPGFIKIDVEGMELQVLKGARGTLLKNRPTVIIEENNLCLRYGHRLGSASRMLQRMGAAKVATFYMPPERDENRVFRFDRHKNSTEIERPI